MDKFRLFLVAFSLLFLVNTYITTVEYIDMSKQVCSIKFNHPLSECPHSTSIPPSSVLNFIIGFAFLGWGLFGKLPTRAEEKPQNIDYNTIISKQGISDECKSILELLAKNNGEMLQRDLINMTGLSKPKVTRLLNKLEDKGLIFRKRKGISNVVMLNLKNS